MLYASTPIDASLFGLYIHQNYTQYCSSLEQCSSLIDSLSWADANESENVATFLSRAFFVNTDNGKQWYDANPHAFHILALGTLHSLPSPVPRTGQLICKPEFFGALRREHGARDALERTSFWLSDVRSVYYSGNPMLRSYRLDFGRELRSRRNWEVCFARWAATPRMDTVLSRSLSLGRILCVQKLLMKGIAREGALAMRRASDGSHIRAMNRLRAADTWRTMISRTGSRAGVTN